MQHRHNPVDWYPWGPEALERARAEDRPILLSVGYSACHWCHVMERECFEDPAIAEQMNRLYVCIKVDREERPDIDNLYQTVVQLQRRSGGWPLTVFLLPDGRPFYSGTYFPPEPRHGIPAFPQVLEQVHRAYAERREDVEKAGSAIAAAIVSVQAPSEGEVSLQTFEDAGRFLSSRIDTEDGGFGEAPKFPSIPNLTMLWRWAISPAPDAEGEEERDSARAAVLLTLDRMARGGIRDHIGGGWHRYSTDADWLVPHFEKMLYDQALIVPICIDAARWCDAAGAAGQTAQALRDAARQACAWVLREMTSPEGLFYSATDADSEGVEGKFFVWERGEVERLLGPDAAAFCAVYDITERGNWEGHNIARLKAPLDQACQRVGIAPSALEAMRQTLFDARAKRVPPTLDDKVLVAWNAWMISALVAMDGSGDADHGGDKVGPSGWLTAALRAADALFSTLMRDGQLLHSRCKGQSAGLGFLDDHAALGLACLQLAEATTDARWLDRALGLATAIQTRFHAPGGYYQTPEDGEALMARPRDGHDSATPSGTGLAASFFLRLHAHTAEPRWLAEVERTLHAHGAQLQQNPFGNGVLTATIEPWIRGYTEVVLGGHADALHRTARAQGDGNTVILQLAALPEGHPAQSGRTPEGPTAWVCSGTTCSMPVHDAEALTALLRTLTHATSARALADTGISE